VTSLGPVRSRIRHRFCIFALSIAVLFSLNATAQNGQLQVLPASIGFGKVSVGSSQTVSLTLKNSGGPKITITAANLSGTSGFAGDAP
jgi:hypothetical protein